MYVDDSSCWSILLHPDPYDNKICGAMNNAIHFTIQTKKPIS